LVTSSRTASLPAVDLGDGNDTFKGGSTAETVRDGAGSDSYKLRGGGDTFLAVKDDFRSPGTDLADHVDGGTGVDTYVLNYTGTGSIFVVNLDSKVHLSVDGHSAFQLFGPTDTVLNFENVTGSASVDDIFGTSGANRIDGGAGADQIAGLGGRDVLTGGDDDDTFVFTRASDSGVTAAKRDVITDFRPSLDKIDLTAIETAAGHNFVFKDVGPFDHTSCELRETYNGGNTIIWGDVNGDNKADFSIALQGHWLLEQSDFL
jgi:Ca2+-binding RTX toxin-like protein